MDSTKAIKLNAEHAFKLLSMSIKNMENGLKMTLSPINKTVIREKKLTIHNSS